MFQFLKDSKITLNTHGEKINFAANVRLYEATGVGTCLLTDWKENIESIFVPDKEIVTYKTKEEARDKIKFLLKNDSLCKKIALAGQKKTLENYTYDKRIVNMIEFIKGLV
jgi:spore maturation protein CgeB